MPRTRTAKKVVDNDSATLQIVSPRAAPVVNRPTLGSVFAESMTSGVGFGLGSALVRSIFGPVTTPNNDYTQCLEQNTDTSACYHLSNEYKACMVRTNFNQTQCRDLYS